MRKLTLQTKKMAKSSEKSPNFFCIIDVYLLFLVYHLSEKKSANSDNYFDYGMENEKVRMFLSNFLEVSFLFSIPII